MKLIIIPPYKGPNYTPERGQFMLRELVDSMEKRGQLKGVQVDIDEGPPYPSDSPPVNRDELFLAHISIGVIKKVKEYSEMGKYDAIVTSGNLGDPGFFAAREVSRIPVAAAVHSGVHVASLLGERFTLIGPADPGALVKRHYIQNYGLSNKLVSVRPAGYTTTYMMGFIQKYPKQQRSGVPEIRDIIQGITNQCMAAIEKDRADTLILGCPVLQIFEDEVRKNLDDSGYGEIQIVCELSAAIEMAKVMVNMKLIQAPRAYPSDALKAKPEFR